MHSIGFSFRKKQTNKQIKKKPLHSSKHNVNHDKTYPLKTEGRSLIAPLDQEKTKQNKNNKI